MARHGDGFRQGFDEGTGNLGYYLCLKRCSRRQWQPHSLFPGLWTITWLQDTRSDLHALEAATRIVLISITYKSHGASIISQLVRRSLGQCPSFFSSRPGQAPVRI